MSVMDVERAIAVASRPWQHTDAERDAAYRFLGSYDDAYGVPTDVMFAFGKLVAYNIMCTLATISQKGL